MTTWGISALHHDAAITVTHGQNILFAGHSERYSKIKNDPLLHEDLIKEALTYGTPTDVIWYESPWKKRTRYLYSGQFDKLLESPKKYVKQLLGKVNFHTVDHHKSHAYAGYSTSPFKNAAVVVIDAIGEWTTLSVWHANASIMKCVYKQSYPHSMGLMYSAFTKLCGLKPNEEEYILMGMAAHGEPKFTDMIYDDLVNDLQPPHFSLKENLHKGLPKYYDLLVETEKDKFDIAASIQEVTELCLVDLIRWVRTKVDSRNLILMGGVALNCVANTRIAQLGLYDDIWIMPNPGDAGSSLGAVGAFYNMKLNWQNPYLGTDINRELDIDQVCDILIKPGSRGIVGVANGRAEFGPRALGNRSLLANPMELEIKDAVNKIKRRQRFRPFAPAILEKFANSYFNMPKGILKSPYMQYAVNCKFVNGFPAICHVDGTSRVQTVSNEDNPIFYELLSEFHRRTGCPMLLNTSLNIKGMPLVNSWNDALEFSTRYNVPVF